MPLHQHSLFVMPVTCKRWQLHLNPLFSDTSDIISICSSRIYNIIFPLLPVTLREKCPNTEFILVPIFLYSDWIRRFTPYISVFIPNIGKYGPVFFFKKPRIWTLFTQCNGDRLFHFPNITNQFVSLFLLLGLLMKNLWRSCFAFTSSSLLGTSNSLLLCILGLTIILYLSDTWSWSWSGPSSKRSQFFLIITMVTINFFIKMIYVSQLICIYCMIEVNQVAHLIPLPFFLDLLQYGRRTLQQSH